MQVVEPNSGQLRTLFLHSGLDKADLKNLFLTCFDKTITDEDKFLGFQDDHSNIYYPFSVLCQESSIFDGKTLSMIISNRPMHPLNASSSNSYLASKSKALTSASSEDTLYTEESAEMVFKMLDMNDDDKIHVEEFIECMTSAYSCLFQEDPRISFAYSCIGSNELAISTSINCYSSIKDYMDPYRLNPDDLSYYIDYDDFCVWYFSTEVDPFRELVVRALNCFQRNLNGFQEEEMELTGSSNLKRTQSRPTLSGIRYSDTEVQNFVTSCQENLQLNGENTSYILHLLKLITANNVLHISRSKFTQMLMTFLASAHMPADEERMNSISELIDLLFDLCKPNKQDHVQIPHLASLLSLLTDDIYLQHYQAVFDIYGDSEGNAPDSILFSHLCQIFRLIYYFSPDIQSSSGCFPEDLAHAISTKYLLLIDVSRKTRFKLSFPEFVEVFIHGLNLGLTMLSIEEGIFVDYLKTLIGTATEDGQDDDDEQDDDIDDVTGLPRSPRSPPPNSPGVRIANSLSTNEYLEDSQVTSLFVNYAGNAITIEEARSILGFSEYAPDDILGYMKSLSDQYGVLSHEAFEKGILTLMSKKYVSLNVLQRSKVDFILDRLFSVFDTKNFGYCNVRELCCGLLLFCNGTPDELAESAFVLLLLLENAKPGHKDPYHSKSDALHLLTAVKSVSSLMKAKICLDPNIRLEECVHAEHVAAKETLQFFIESLKGYDSANAIEQLEDCQIVRVNDYSLLFRTVLEQLAGDDAPGYDLTAPPSPVKQRRFTDLQWPVGSNDSSVGDLADQFSGNDNMYTDSDGEDSDSGDDVDAVPPNNKTHKRASLMVNIDSNSEKDSDQGSDDDDSSHDAYLDDEKFPPSSVVLELRAAQSVLGLDTCPADDLMETLGMQSEEGMLDMRAWLNWLHNNIVHGNMWAEDVEIAMALGKRLFSVMSMSRLNGRASARSGSNGIASSSSSNGAAGESVCFASLAVGLAFLCGGSPLEDRLMVAFTMVDDDSDGYISKDEFIRMVLSVLIVVTTCSKLAGKKVVALEVPLDTLAAAAALEAVSALGLSLDDDTDELSLDMVCEISGAFLKLAAIY